MRRFEFVQGSSSKFWQGDVEGTTFVVVYGKIGTAGQRKDKAFPTAESAQRELDKKIAEKVREGYQEVSVDGSAAPAPEAKGAQAATSKLDLPARVQAREASPEAIKAAADALTALTSATSKRSWDAGRKARRARRALSAVAGVDPASNDALEAAFQAAMARVVAPKASERIPLVRAMELLYELDAAAFERAVLSIWSDAPAGSPAKGALTVLAKQLAELEEPELALRVGALLVDRPDRGSMSSEAGWTQRWKALAPHLDAYLTKKGGSLKGYLKGIDAAGDAFITRRISRMLAA